MISAGHNPFSSNEGQPDGGDTNAFVKNPLNTLPTTKEIREMLDENDAFLQAISEFTALRRPKEVYEYIMPPYIYRFQKRLNRNLTALLQIYNRQSSNQANRPDFLNLNRPPKRSARSEDDSADGTHHKRQRSVIENNGFDMPKLV